MCPNGRLSLSQKSRHFDHWLKMVEIFVLAEIKSNLHGPLQYMRLGVFFSPPGPRVSENRKYGGFQIAKEEFCKTNTFLREKNSD